MELSSPVRQRNIIDSFRTVVEGKANELIVWSTSNKPFDEFPGSYLSSGGVSRTNNLVSPSTAVINASVIYNTLISETNEYVHLRNLRAIRHVTASGGPAAYNSFDQTAKTAFSRAHLASINNLKNIANPDSTFGVARNQTIRIGSIDQGLNAFFQNLKTKYEAVRDDAVTIQIDVCHNSCHNSCHSSRSRR